ncbi:acyl-CoA dehydrogenase family protein [Rhodopseudomonas palustris]
MNYRSSWMNEQRDAVRDTACTFLEKESALNQARRAKQHHVDRGSWNAADGLGLLGVSCRFEYGGRRAAPSPTKPLSWTTSAYL